MKPDFSPIKSTGKNAKKSADLAANSSASGVNPDLRHQMIATAAYYRAERRGFDGSDPNIDWCKAEIEVDRMLQGSAEGHDDLVRLKALLTEWDAQFEELTSKAARAKTQTRAEYRKQLQAMADKRMAISEKLEDLRRKTGAVWNDLKSAIENAWDELCQETEGSTSRFMQEETSAAVKRKRETQ